MRFVFLVVIITNATFLQTTRRDQMSKSHRLIEVSRAHFIRRELNLKHHFFEFLTHLHSFDVN